MKIESFTVLPDTPDKLKHLNELAYNLYFSWNKDVTDLFKKLCRVSWEASNCNPARMLCLVPQEKLNQAAQSKDFLAELEEVYDKYSAYLDQRTWFEKKNGDGEPLIAYFCAEFGLHECLPVYSGGLGILAGDLMKSASDLGVPVVGVGLLYRQGYFRQYLNAEGMQQEQYPENDWYSMPVSLEKDDYGTPIKCSIDLAGQTVWFQIWRVDVGRCSIYLLDTNVDDNSQKLRDMTKMLYDQDRQTRLCQEILLGIGGMEALTALGLRPNAYHVNEGHSAFMLLERIRRHMIEDQMSYDEAREVVWATSVFTTHTPVPAGNERFAPHLMQMYFPDYVQQLGLDWESFMALGRENPYDPEESFCMTVLALRLSAYANGVSRLHGRVSRMMWNTLYNNIPEDEIPIGYVTNGVHAHSWLNPNLMELFRKNIGDEKVNDVSDLDMWRQVDSIPDKDLWAIRKESRERLVHYVRERVRWQLLRRGARAGEISRVHEMLDPNALTIGFARRFTTYKRGYLLMMNPERLRQILGDPERPVQIVIAGKAHPADHSAKEIIRQLCELANEPELRNRIVFLEDYDMAMARHLVQGVDVWLNTPRRPLEASGTSGMKAAINGGLNLSVLDGWWDEAFSTDYGWAIGQGETFEDHKLQDQIESDLLYGALEREIVPLFYDLDKNGRPAGWIKMVKRSISSLGTEFNSHRMVDNYYRRFYRFMLENEAHLTADQFARARELAAWRKKLEREWHNIEILGLESPINDFIYKGTELEVRAKLRLGEVLPENVIVECYHGPLDADNHIKHPQRVRMKVEMPEDDITTFLTRIPCTRGGHYGYTVRILPGHQDLALEFIPGFLKWLE